ncbi:unnamed protein product [Rotaria sp. Silwood2]|nr:unnamed protein product [Rotaria sp. Silwood2]CAF2528380.1 unnamed protein product [Rotaria sp. Silwood2]CAF2760821.1 unnamed protein product [Rotaria sp. Silwood2]CAF2938804.1 unnamed protein product [Rotaria sp. Silwood2]CAF4147072.1 unnamed protein product [Rotaria sp. Silwood2]
MDHYRIIFKYDLIKDDVAIQLTFNSALSEDRKDLIKWHTEDIKQQGEQNLSVDYLYKKKIQNKLIEINLSIKNLFFFPNQVLNKQFQDDLKPGQRKIMFACFTKKLISKIKVAQLADKVTENSVYHHDEL